MGGTAYAHIMHTIAQRLSGRQIEAVSQFYGALPAKSLSPLRSRPSERLIPTSSKYCRSRFRAAAQWISALVFLRSARQARNAILVMRGIPRAWRKASGETLKSMPDPP